MTVCSGGRFWNFMQDLKVECNGKSMVVCNLYGPLIILGCWGGGVVASVMPQDDAPTCLNHNNFLINYASVVIQLK